jgi:hypothetical protein
MNMLINIAWILTFWIYVYLNWRAYSQPKKSQTDPETTKRGLLLIMFVLFLHICNLYLGFALNLRWVLHPLLSHPMPLSIMSLICVDVILRRFVKTSLMVKASLLLILVIFSVSLGLSSSQSPSFYRQFLSADSYCPLSRPTVVTTYNQQALLYESANTYQFIYQIDSNPELVFCKPYVN